MATSMPDMVTMVIQGVVLRRESSLTGFWESIVALTMTLLTYR